MKIKSALVWFGVGLMMALGLCSCGGTDYVPKPRGMNHIELPEHVYQLFNSDTVAYTFEYSKHASVSAHHERKEEQIISYDSMGAKVWLTYLPIKQDNDLLEEYIYNTYKLLQKNNVKAYAILNDTIKTSSGKTATIFYLEGEVPTQYQFYTHDSTRNFIRGALYFETAIKNDSLAPVIEYVKQDINQLINTLNWKNP